MIAYFERPPDRALSWAVKAFWHLEGHLLGEAAAIPKPYVELVISLGDGHEWSAGERATGFAGGWITPIQTGPRFSRSLGVTRFVAARLHPDAAILLFGPLPLGDGAPPVLAEDVIGRDFRDLRDRLGEQSHPAARIDLLQAWVARRLPPPPAGLRVAPAEPWRAEQLCQLLGWTDRDLRRRFARTIGCSPKYWLRLHRLSAVLGAPGFQQGRDTLADTAASFGFADQAHLAREFRLLAGMPPSAYQKRREAEGLDTAPTMAPRAPVFPSQAGRGVADSGLEEVMA
jgi:AraC-like DNA-binding protein